MRQLDIIRITVALVLAGIGIVAIMAMPCEGIALSRWCLLMLVSKAVGIGAMGIAFWLLKKHINDENM